MASSPPPTSAPAPSSPPSPPAPSAPPPSNSTAGAPPPISASTPPPVPASTPPPAPASTPPPTSTPTPAVPSSPPPTTPSPPAPPPASTSPPAPPPASTPPQAAPSVPAPSTPTPGSAPPPTATPLSPPPPPVTPSAPSGGSPSRPSGRTPPSPPRAPSPPSSPSPSSSISTPVVIGVAVGAVVLLAFLSILFICCKKKRRRRPAQEEYYGVPPPMPPPRKDNIYGEQHQNWQHNVPPPADHVVKIQPHLSPPPAYASRLPNMPPPTPPPAINSSGGSNYSGSENILPPPSPGIALGHSQSNFTYDELLMATDGFSDANLLGQGGFGYVHRGVLRNGKEVAVKQLKSGSGQGEREFQAEVEIISRVHHKHLVSLVGYCITGSKRLLVYEFVPNNTLEFHLHGKGRPTMDWSTRLKIALGSAKGLAYLHEDCHPKIIHRDIKAANILLDFNFETKVADFGLAKFASDTNTHVSTRVMGTFGYLAPEYASTGKLTDKSDVFSFGVMLLEMVTGRRPVDSTNTLMEESFVDWAWPLLTRALEDGNYDTLADPRLRNNYNTKEMARMVACAAACIRHSARRRPRLSQVVRALEGDISLDDINEGVKPGESSMYGSYGSSDYDSSQYNNDMKRFKKLALTSEEYGSTDFASGQNPEKRTSRLSGRTSQEYPSSEYSAATSEYGQNPSGSSSEVYPSREMDAKMEEVRTRDSSSHSGPS